MEFMDNLNTYARRRKAQSCFRPFFVLLWLLSVPFCVLGQNHLQPKIFGIRSAKIICGEQCVSTAFYSKILPLSGDCWDCQGETPFKIDDSQELLLARLNPGARTNLLLEVTFATDNVEHLHDYLNSHGIVSTFSNSTLNAFDPEGNHISFVRPPGKTWNYSHGVRGMRLIHAGFIVKDRAAMDKFYRDILGFHLYWSGGMKDGETSWVSMQVPDGTDWIEYMLNVDPNADQRLRGVMNHIALGVPSVKEAAIQLEKNGVKLTEQPKIGRDGKWQLNLYDPDMTRVELMEFTPVEKPCCSEFTGTHPKP